MKVNRFKSLLSSFASLAWSSISKTDFQQQLRVYFLLTFPIFLNRKFKSKAFTEKLGQTMYQVGLTENSKRSKTEMDPLCNNKPKCNLAILEGEIFWRYEVNRKKRKVWYKQKPSWCQGVLAAHVASPINSVTISHEPQGSRRALQLPLFICP